MLLYNLFTVKKIIKLCNMIIFVWFLAGFDMARSRSGSLKWNGSETLFKSITQTYLARILRWWFCYWGCLIWSRTRWARTLSLRRPWPPRYRSPPRDCPRTRCRTRPAFEIRGLVLSGSQAQWDKLPLNIS